MGSPVTESSCFERRQGLIFTSLSYRNWKCYSFLSESPTHYASENWFERDVTKTRNGEPGTGNGEQESGNERSAVFHLKIQNGGRENSPVEKRTTQVAKSTANLS